MADTTPTQRLAENILRQPLADFVSTRRPRSWRLIARDLYEHTSGEIDVTPETLRSWYGTAELAETA